MTGLVPAINAIAIARCITWMAATSPAVTEKRSNMGRRPARRNHGIAMIQSNCRRIPGV
jgi:hypothetical protein